MGVWVWEHWTEMGEKNLENCQLFEGGVAYIETEIYKEQFSGPYYNLKNYYDS